jgi:hypothetical protein
MAHHPIEVELVVKTTPSGQHANSKHTVQWSTKDGDLKIIFAESPFESGALILDGTGGKTGIEKIAKCPKKGYKYTVEVTTPGRDVFSKDPDLIIDDGGGGPGKTKTAKKKTPKKKAKK